MPISIKPKSLVPRAALAFFVALLYWFYGSGIDGDSLQSIASVIAGVSGTLLGFLITAIALLTAVMDRTLIANMRHTGHYDRLVGDTFMTCAFLLATVSVSITSLFFSGLVQRCAFAGLVFIFVLSLLYVIQAGARFKTVISLL